MNYCIIDNCGKVRFGHGWCNMHWWRWRKHGDPLKLTVPKHHMKGTPEHQAWANMVQRCHNENHFAYKNYGGRGIKVSARWRKFQNFYADMGNRPEGLTLERLNNNLGYSKSNCVWATRIAQANNRRPRSTTQPTRPCC